MILPVVEAVLGRSEDGNTEHSEDGVTNDALDTLLTLSVVRAKERRVR